VLYEKSIVGMNQGIDDRVADREQVEVGDSHECGIDPIVVGKALAPVSRPGGRRAAGV
jgi:hypothetical protein